MEENAKKESLDPSEPQENDNWGFDLKDVFNYEVLEADWDLF